MAYHPSKLLLFAVKGSHVQDIHVIQRQYGSFVHFASSEIFLAQGGRWNDSYCRRQEHHPFSKDLTWRVNLSRPNPSVMNTPSLAMHRRVRQILNACFTLSTLQSQEPIVVSHADKLVDQS